jgi:hypothetical protein
MIFIAVTATTGKKRQKRFRLRGKAILFVRNARKNVQRIWKKVMKDTAAKMISDMRIHTHKMTLYNHDLVITWQWENNRINITEVHIIHNGDNNLLKFMSGKVFKFIVEDIENHGSKI